MRIWGEDHNGKFCHFLLQFDFDRSENYYQ